MKGRLFLVPVTIGDTEVDQVIPAYVLNLIHDIRHYIVENERTARRMLIKLGIRTPIDDLRFYILDKHTTNEEISSYLDPIDEGDMGLLSEAGVPAIADPGGEIVAMAHRRNIRVVPLVGPSSILLAMMASGMNGQNFAFNGYLPIQRGDRAKRIRQLESRSSTEKQAQIFIETPYRNNQLLEDLLVVCSDHTMLCIAADISGENEFIRTQSVQSWKKTVPDINKRPAIFILQKN